MPTLFSYHTPGITVCRQHWPVGCPLSSTVQRSILAADGELLGGGLNGGRSWEGCSLIQENGSGDLNWDVAVDRVSRG